ncbi:YybH family protein [Streptomyces sp. NPDC090077]|uniref:YybH family protein n=1 Tax=Streptomyces sp. NPDC090077 TaxID=3365938 RepID=UPI0037FC89D7
MKPAASDAPRTGLPIDVRPRHTYATGELALLIVDRTTVGTEGTGPDGGPVRLAGTATDIARRGPDGLWRYVVDNPFGTSPA